MKRFLKLFLIATFAFAISFGLASCGGGEDTVSKEEYDRIVEELAEKAAELAALQESSVAKDEFDAKVQELLEKTAEIEALKEELDEVKNAVNDLLQGQLKIVPPADAEYHDNYLVLDVGETMEVGVKLADVVDVADRFLTIQLTLRQLNLNTIRKQESHSSRD